MSTSYLRTTPGAPSEVTLQVPETMGFQLVYRQRRTRPFTAKNPEGTTFVLVDSLKVCLHQSSMLIRIFGMMGFLKPVAKVLSGRVFYFVYQGPQVLHTGWMTVSSCRYYRVTEGDVVIGPIWSDDQCRGRGVGAFATQMAMNAMISRGRTVFFIDTDNTNISCQRLIEKCDFGSPVASYLR